MLNKKRCICVGLFEMNVAEWLYMPHRSCCIPNWTEHMYQTSQLYTQNQVEHLKRSTHIRGHHCAYKPHAGMGAKGWWGHILPPPYAHILPKPPPHPMPHITPLRSPLRHHTMPRTWFQNRSQAIPQWFEMILQYGAQRIAAWSTEWSWNNPKTGHAMSANQICTKWPHNRPQSPPNEFQMNLMTVLNSQELDRTTSCISKLLET